MGVLADVALPEVEEIHVVDGRLASLDLDQDAGVSDREEVVGTQRAREVPGEQPFRLVPETE